MSKAKPAQDYYLSHTEGRSPLLKSPLTFRPMSNKDFFSAAEPPERSQRNHWSGGKVILLSGEKYWRTIHEYLVLKRCCRSHFSRSLDQLSRKNRYKPVNRIPSARNGASVRAGCKRDRPGFLSPIFYRRHLSPIFAKERGVDAFRGLWAPRLCFEPIDAVLVAAYGNDDALRRQFIQIIPCSGRL